jgi:hypothetical protein
MKKPRKGKFRTLEVLEKIEELQQEAENEGMEYAVLQLSRLREHIIALSQ